MDKLELLEHPIEARAELLAAIEDLSEAEVTALPVAGVWTIKDILAHIGSWAAWDLAGITGILAGEIPDFSAIQDVDTFNAQLVAERNAWSLDQILAEMRDTQAALQELLAGLPDEDLFRSGPFQGPYWDNLGPSDPLILVTHVWPQLSTLAGHYRAYVAGYKPVLCRFEAGILDDEKCFAARLQSLIDFVAITLGDPALPPSLLPKDWPRPSAKLLFKELQHTLAQPAKCFFDAIYETKGETDRTDRHL